MRLDWRGCGVQSHASSFCSFCRDWVIFWMARFTSVKESILLTFIASVTSLKSCFPAWPVLSTQVLPICIVEGLVCISLIGFVVFQSENVSPAKKLPATAPSMSYAEIASTPSCSIIRIWVIICRGSFSMYTVSPIQTKKNIETLFGLHFRISIPVA